MAIAGTSYAGYGQSPANSFSGGAGAGAVSGLTSGLLAGGVVGGVVGLIGGAIEAAQARKDAARSRRRQRSGIRAAMIRGEIRAANILGLDNPHPGLELTPLGVKRSRPGAGPPVVSDSLEGGDPTAQPTLFQLGSKYLRDTFQNPTASPLVQNIAKQIQAAQASRGMLGGGAAISAEALGTGVAAAQLQASLLPQLVEYNLLPERLRQEITGFEAPLLVAARTGGTLGGVGPSNIGTGSVAAAALQQAIAGGLGGWQIAQSFGQDSISTRLRAIEDSLSRRRI